MITVTTDFIQGKKVKETLGHVKGNTIQAKSIGKDIKAGFRHMAGGEMNYNGATVRWCSELLFNNQSTFPISTIPAITCHSYPYLPCHSSLHSSIGGSSYRIIRLSS